MSSDEKDDDFDLTPLDQLSEYSHESDTETDRLLEEAQEESAEETSAEETTPEESLSEEQTSEDIFQGDGAEEETTFENDWGETGAGDAGEGDFAEESGPETAAESGAEESEELGQDFAEDVAEESAEESVEEPQSEFGDGPAEESVENLAEEPAEEVTEEPVEDVAAESAPVEPPPVVTQENFQDLRDFSEAISYGTVGIGGNPPFGLLVRGVRYREDAERILSILREHGLCTQENEKVLWSSLENGNLLISQISEYSAVYLAHRLRRFDADIQVGLSDELHPSKHYAQDERGLVSKYSLKQNISENEDLSSHIVDAQDIIVATAAAPVGYRIRRYIQAVMAHSVLNREELGDIQQNWPNDEKAAFPLNDLFGELAEQLKSDAFKRGGNAVVGVKYQIIPLPEVREPGQPAYKMICTGDAVWLESE